MKRLISIVLIVAGCGVVIWWVYVAYLAPENSVINRSQATDAAQEAMFREDWDAALAAIEQGLASAPDDWELLVWRSVLGVKTRQPNDDLDRAFSLAPAADVWTVRGMVALLVREAELAIEAGERLVESAPDTPHGYYLTAQAYELLNRDREALAQYREAEQRAADHDEYTAIYVAARERIFFITSLPGD